MKRPWILLTAASLSLGSVLPTSSTSADDREDDEEEVTMDQLPQPVRATVEREAQGGRVAEVERLTDNGRLFKAEIKRQDSKQLVYIDGDGKVIGRRTEKK